MTPDFKVIAAGVNITPQIRDRLLSLTITDEAGIKADTVEIVLDDRDWLIELPAPGAALLVFLGYRETGLIPMGLFTSDEVTVSSPPATLTTREAYRSVVALWQDTDAAKRQEVKAGEGAPTLRLRHFHQTEAEASAAATAKLDEITRGSDTFEATFPGDPLIAAETRILAAGFRAGVNGPWSITTATHTLDGSGFTTSISAERPGPD